MHTPTARVRPTTPANRPALAPRGRSSATSRRSARAVGYLRRSTDRQEQSIPDQQKAVEAYCAQQGLRLLRLYTDDAISGTSAVGRKAFQQMLADAQAQGCDFGLIVVYDVKRFGRVDNDEAGYYRHLLRTHGVEVRYASENFSGDGTDDLLRPVKQWQAREESKDLSKVTIRGLLSKSQSGFWMGGAPPFGLDLRYESQSGQFLLRLRYNADGTKLALDDRGKVMRKLERGESIAVSRKDRCRLVPGDPARIEVVQLIFRMYVQERRGFKAIADALNREKVPTARGPTWAGQYSGQWAMSTIRAILTNPAYCGDMAWNRRTDARFHRIGDGQAVVRDDVVGRRLEPNERADWIVVKDAHPGAIPRRLWDQAQRRLAEKPQSAEQRGINPRTGVPVGRQNPHVTGGWTGPRARFLLSGLCTCVRCGSRYEGYATRSNQKQPDGTRAKWYSYACGAAIRRGPSVCRLGLVRQELLEGRVADAVVAYYKRYRGIEGRKRLRDAARTTLGGQHDKIMQDTELTRRRLEKVQSMIRNLLDNITAANRGLADERLKELGRERETLLARAEEFAGAALPESEVQRILTETGTFLASLGGTLREADLGTRQAAARRCIQRVWIDYEKDKASADVFLLPALAWNAHGAAAAPVEVDLTPP